MNFSACEKWDACGKQLIWEELQRQVMALLQLCLLHSTEGTIMNDKFRRMWKL
jgi:hypothetical protein